MPNHCRKGQNNYVYWNSDQRFYDGTRSKTRSLRLHRAAEQGPSQHESAIPPDGGYNFICDSFITPDKAVTPFDHSVKKLLVFSLSELWAERASVTSKQFSL